MNLIPGKFTITGAQDIYYTGEGFFNYGGHLDKREAVMSTQGVVGYRSKPQVPYIVGNLINDSDISIRDLEQIESCTLTIDFLDGRQIVLRDAWSDIGNFKINEKEKFISCQWKGISLEVTN